MDIIITFFRDILDGPLYIVVTVICSILICSCIGYLGEQYLNKKKQREEYAATHTQVTSDMSGQTATIQAAPSIAQPTSQAQSVSNGTSTNQGQ